ncbi:hypothetical protein N0O92_13495 [Alkalihalobacillus sp. MEB130]|uniref:SunI/YnzG family protein n=1 Tax=Alkalihalobacillus sp. MEB130 TaxID=2976704 RepID=UPI0028DFD413|nr:hypothetical protein [Alkalihalobacillus sp. MEB130]MDT8861251.1 hypothetical protein [Alkalihalobacillus sp. MEB130]
MFEVKIEQTKDDIVFKWQLSKMNIPITDIVDVTSDDTYAGDKSSVMRIGYPYGTTERIYIKTQKSNYLVFTSKASIKEQIVSAIKRKRKDN